MAKDIVIKAEGIGKRYRLGGNVPYKALRDTLADGLKLPIRAARSLVNRQSGTGKPKADDWFWALDDVSFEVKQGEVVGLIGRNGAGKSTLLKVLSRITEPTRGRIELDGRVGSLLEVGTGFHPELTGRENIFLNGAILGMTRAEIRSKFDEIVDFAEIERFLDTPVKHYSSGMYVRLAFSVAAHLEPEILLVDEVLAVGDTGFQKKCMGKMKGVAATGRTILFVSHNLAAINNLCHRAVVLDKGRTVCDAETRKAVDFYTSSLRPDNRSRNFGPELRRRGNGRVRLTGYDIRDSHGKSQEALRSGMNGALVLQFEKQDGQSLDEVQLTIAFDSVFGERVMVLGTEYVGDGLVIEQDRGEILVHLKKLHLTSGLYSLTLYLAQRREVLDWVGEACQIHVDQGDFFGTGKVPDRQDGYLLQEHNFTVI